MTASQTQLDPLAAFMAGAFAVDSGRPVPLVSTSFAVTIEAGLAVVETKRCFRNREYNSIEATITFPLPVHATLFSLVARIGKRTLTAYAESRDGARQTYEAAVERGQSAVLHEEVLRGVHMLSVGHIPTDADIEVTTLWATTVCMAGDGATLRIPLTVGDIYGRSALPDSDALVHGGPAQRATLQVRNTDGDIELIGGRLENGRAFVPLNAPIDLRIPAWTPRALTGWAADGREVTLRIDRPPTAEQAIDVAILVDRSGSMKDRCSAAADTTKHDAVVDGLGGIARRLGTADAVDLWEFDEVLGHVGATRDLPRATRSAEATYQTPQARLIALADRLSAPSGGTEIGKALRGVVDQSPARDILLVTDGKSDALEVQALAGAGRRITVILVGEDSLEAHVGHLAALTGGEIFVATGADLSDVMVAAFATLRRLHTAAAPVEGELSHIEAHRGGARFTADWHAAAAAVANGSLGRATAAFAAGLALPSLPVDAATDLAVAEGLVTHLTSLVLVDEAGPAQEGLPGVRKLSLPTPRTVQAPVTAYSLGHARPVAHPSIASPVAAAPAMPSATPSVRRPLSADEMDARARALADVGRPERERAQRHFSDRERRAGMVVRIDLSRVGATIDWNLAPNDLLVGDLTSLDRKSARLIESAATLPELAALARSLGISPITLVVALLAHEAATASRSAARIAYAILDTASSPGIMKAKAMLGLS